MHRYLMDLRDDDLYWSTADFGWLAGPITLYGSLFWGVNFLTYRGEFDAEEWARILHEYPVTVFYSIPTAFRMLRDDESILDGRDLSLRHALSVGEPLDASTVEWSADALGARIHELYGSTETGGSPICNLPIYEVKPGSMGRPFPDTAVAVLDPDTREEVEVGEVGEIAVDRSFPSLFTEYWNDPEATDEAFHGRWHLMGDLAQEDEDGYYWFKGRADDIILSSGYRIGPFEVESSLNDHGAVAESAVVPKPDDTRGNIVKAYVVPSESAILDDEAAVAETLKAHVRETLSAHEYPREIEFVEDLPRTITGKIRRTELRDRER
jgi:acetyl-CoA synthetase